MSTFLQLKTELSDRGFAHITLARRGALINRARERLDGMHTWTYREQSATGLAPLSLPTLGIIEAVSNETQNYPIPLVGYGDLVFWGCDLSDTGSPEYAYRSTPSDDPTVATWPTSTDTIGVQYWSVTPDLSADTDVPEAPARFHGLIVDMAVQLAYRDSDNHKAAEALQIDIDRQTAQMVDDLISQQEPSFIRITGSFDG